MSHAYSSKLSPVLQWMTQYILEGTEVILCRGGEVQILYLRVKVDVPECRITLLQVQVQVQVLHSKCHSSKSRK